MQGHETPGINMAECKATQLRLASERSPKFENKSNFSQQNGRSKTKMPTFLRLDSTGELTSKCFGDKSKSFSSVSNEWSLFSQGHSLPKSRPQSAMPCRNCSNTPHQNSAWSGSTQKPLIPDSKRSASYLPFRFENNLCRPPFGQFIPTNFSFTTATMHPVLNSVSARGPEHQTAICQSILSSVVSQHLCETMSPAKNCKSPCGLDEQLPCNAQHQTTTQYSSFIKSCQNNLQDSSNGVDSVHIPPHAVLTDCGNSINHAQDTMICNSVNSQVNSEQARSESDCDIEMEEPYSHSKPCNSQSNNSKKSKNSSAMKHKTSVDLSSVLSTPRKVQRKGRPSAKKQNKRRRQKARRKSDSAISLSNQTEKQEQEVKSNTLTNEKTPQKDVCGNESESGCKNVNRGHSLSVTIVTSSPQVQFSHPKTTTSDSGHARKSSICHILYASFSDSDSDSSCEDSDDDSDWASPSSPVASSPINSSFFGSCLTFDSLFKTTNTCSSLTNAAQKPKNSTIVTPSITTDSTFSGNSSVDLNDLSFDIEWESGCSSPVTSTITVHSEYLCVSPSVCLESCSCAASPSASREAEIRAANKKWNEYYSPSQSCGNPVLETNTADKSQSKVRFAVEGSMVTVHEVENYDRRGHWHLFAIDRDRFQDRLRRVSPIISPVLTPEHRQSIQMRNQGLGV